MQTTIAAIPTTYNGIRFRSRLEAKWAAFFDIIGWKWQYEPIDLEGYIPDFILTRRRVLVECKPFETKESIQESYEKIINSGWRRDFLIVGPTLYGAILTVPSTGIWVPRSAEFVSCGPCEIGIVGIGERCRICGQSFTSPLDTGWQIVLDDNWKDAANTVQWKGR